MAESNADVSIVLSNYSSIFPIPQRAGLLKHGRVTSTKWPNEFNPVKWWIAYFWNMTEQFSALQTVKKHDQWIQYKTILIIYAQPHMAFACVVKMICVCYCMGLFQHISVPMGPMVVMKKDGHEWIVSAVVWQIFAVKLMKRVFHKVHKLSTKHQPRMFGTRIDISKSETFCIYLYYLLYNDVIETGYNTKFSWLSS